MEGTPRLYDTLVQVLSQHQTWMDRRHLKTLASRIVGLRPSDTISRTAWTPDVHSRAVYAQSTVRRLARWLEKERRAVPALDGPRIQQALAAWGDHIGDRALDPSRWWNPYGLVRTSLGSRGRAMPLAWKVLEQSRSRVADDV